MKHVDIHSHLIMLTIKQEWRKCYSILETPLLKVVFSVQKDALL